MYRQPGPPGNYYGYIEIDGITYKLKAQSIARKHPDARKHEKMYVGTVERHLKADQQQLFPPARKLVERHTISFDSHDGKPVMTVSHEPDPDFDDELPPLEKP